MERVAFASLLLLTTALAPQLARADGDRTLGQHIDDTKQRATAAAQQAAQQAQDRANEAAESAKDRANEVSDKLKDHANEAAESLSERAREVAAHAEALAGTLLENAKVKAGELGERAGDALAQGKVAAEDALQSARDHARAALISAAVALDNKTRDAREAARLQHWEKLKARYKLIDDRPSLALSEELRDHEYRVARLRRVRELASAVRDDKSVANANLLLEQEYGRFKRRVEQLHARELEESQR